jgi:hypothetical protein
LDWTVGPDFPNVKDQSVRHQMRVLSEETSRIASASL